MNEQHKPVKLVLTGEEDQLFASNSYPKPFSFNAEVVRVFDNMVSRSVPLYREVTAATVDWALRFYQPGSLILDIGCSTGTTMDALAHSFHLYNRPLSLMGIDQAEAMVSEAQNKLNRWRDVHEIQWQTGDVRNMEWRQTSVVIINYTLQFLPIEDRLTLLTKIRQNMAPGGVLILSDKVRSDDQDFHNAMTEIYESFKQENGYSKTEIERKKEALDNVLVPLTHGQQMQLLSDAGFRHSEPMIKWNNFLTTISKAP